ncbi:MAG TPA: vitamin K epoxide reductase family protein [Bacillota bacterium]|nr:vitamin K epoxide reductase family protein [Bacillota bacterium]
MKYKYQILLVLFLISLAVSLILAITPTEDLCTIEGKGCDAVQSSKYVETFGIKNDYYGIVVFLFLTILTFLQIKKNIKIRRFLINAGVIISSIFALYFIYIQQFIIKAWCTYCLIVDISTLMALIIVISSWKK